MAVGAEADVTGGGQRELLDQPAASRVPHLGRRTSASPMTATSHPFPIGADRCIPHVFLSARREESPGRPAVQDERSLVAVAQDKNAPVQTSDTGLRIRDRYHRLRRT